MALTAALCLTTGAVTTSAGAAITAQTSASRAGPSLDEGRYSAGIRRTAYGIPHILAQDFGSLGYGYGYAFAQDNVCAMASHVLTLRGERSRYFGPGADSGDTLAPAANLPSDLYYQEVRQSGILQRLLGRPAPLGPTLQVRQLVNGYVAGFNRYLRDTGVAHLPDPTCRGAAWVGPITALDVWSGIYDTNALSGASIVKAPIAAAAPPAAGAAVRGTRMPTVPTAAEAAAVARLGHTIGSNAIAMGSDATRRRDGMLLANPHFPWNGNGRFYQVQLTIPGVLNVSGASLYGTPAVEIGHNDRLAWSHTVSSAQRFTLYQLALVPGDPTSYLVDGKPEHMTRETVQVTVRDSGGGSSTVTRTLYSSRYGPVLDLGSLLPGFGWTTTTAFAIRDVNAGNLRDLNEWIAMGESDSLTGLRSAQDTYQGLPFVNTIATDTSGTAYFADASVVPHVTDEQAARCVDSPQGKAVYPHIFTLDGSAAGCQWGSDPGAIEPGIFAPGHDPQLTRTDYVTNSNDSAWLANPAAPITGYPQIYGDIGTERSLRTRLGLDIIARRLAGTDGLGPAGFTLPALQAATLGDRVYSGELGRDDVVAMCRAHPVLTASNGQPVDVSAACGALAGWDLHGDSGSRGAVLWREFFTLAVQNLGDGLWLVPFDPAHPLTTPRGIDGSQAGVRSALADVVAYFQANHIPLDISLGTAQHYTSVPLHGCTQLEGCYGVVEPGGPLSSSGSYPDVAFGSSFIMAVELTPEGPRSRTILTYSESANPASPHYTDQTVLFSRKEWVSERFTEAEINADHQLQTTLLRS
jgi:acyl-homoserine-lactone acylase